MAGRSTVEVTEQQGRFIDAQVERGLHRDASEVVGEALRRYEADLVEDNEEERIATLRAIAAEGRACIEPGEATVIDGEQAERELFERLNKRAAELARESPDSPDRG